MKKTIFALTLATTMLLSTNLAFADQESMEGTTNEAIKVINLEDAKDIKDKISNYDLIINQSTQEYKYLSDWGNTLRYLGSGKLSLLAYTRTSKIVDTVNTTVFLQQYDESNKIWVNVDSLTNIQSNNNYSDALRTYIVPIGFKYRTLSVHKATDDGITETVSVYSSIINTY